MNELKIEQQTRKQWKVHAVRRFLRVTLLPKTYRQEKCPFFCYPAKIRMWCFVSIRCIRNTVRWKRKRTTSQRKPSSPAMWRLQFRPFLAIASDRLPSSLLEAPIFQPYLHHKSTTAPPTELTSIRETVSGSGRWLARCLNVVNEKTLSEWKMGQWKRMVRQIDQ